MNEETRQYIDSEIKKLEERIKGNFMVPFHIHNGVDSPKIPINAPIMNMVPPANMGNNGDIVLYEVGTTRRIYAKINNVWYSTTIT